MDRIIKVFLLLVLLVFSVKKGSAQNQRIADSLQIILLSNKELSDSAYYLLLYDLAFYHTNPDSSLKYSQELIQKALVNSNEYYVCKGLLQKGNALRLKGDLNSAFNSLFQCVKIAQKMNFLREYGCAFIALGDTYLSANDHKNSLYYYYKSIEILQKQNDSILLANAIFNTGSEYLNIHQIDSALKFFGISELIYKQLNNKTGIAYSIGNKGLAYYKIKNYQLAEKEISYSIALLEVQGDIYPIARYLVGLTNIYEEQGDLKKAISTAQKSYNMATKHGLTQQIRDALEVLSDLYYKSGEYKKAFEYQIKFISFRDSIINQEKIMQIADMRTEYEVSQKQIEVDLLIKKKQTQKLITISLATIIILALVLLCVLYNHNKHNKKLNKQLAEQKEELETQRDQLSELNNTKDRFFSIISHDLRGPVSSLHGFSIILKEYIQSNNTAGLYDLTEELNLSVSKVASLLDNLLDWALSQQGRFPYSPESLQLSNIINGIVNSSSAMAMAKSISIVNETEEKLKVWADRNSLMTVFRNLLNNAIKFSQSNSSIKIFAKKVGNQAEIKVIDYGVGISEDKIADLFKFKKDKSTYGTAKEKGVGLGLSLAYDFVVMNNGVISVKSKPGHGTTFTITIPLVKPNSNDLTPT